MCKYCVPIWNSLSNIKYRAKSLLKERLRYNKAFDTQFVSLRHLHSSRARGKKLFPTQLLMDVLVVLLTLSFMQEFFFGSLARKSCWSVFGEKKQGLAAWFDWHVYNRAGASDDGCVIDFIQYPCLSKSIIFDPPLPHCLDVGFLNCKVHEN